MYNPYNNALAGARLGAGFRPFLSRPNGGKGAANLNPVASQLLGNRLLGAQNRLQFQQKFLDGARARVVAAQSALTQQLSNLQTTTPYDASATSDPSSAASSSPAPTSSTGTAPAPTTPTGDSSSTATTSPGPKPSKKRLRHIILYHLADHGFTRRGSPMLSAVQAALDKRYPDKGYNVTEDMVESAQASLEHHHHDHEGSGHCRDIPHEVLEKIIKTLDDDDFSKESGVARVSAVREKLHEEEYEKYRDAHVSQDMIEDVQEDMDYWGPKFKDDRPHDHHHHSHHHGHHHDEDDEHDHDDEHHDEDDSDSHEQDDDDESEEDEHHHHHDTPKRIVANIIRNLSDHAFTDHGRARVNAVRRELDRRYCHKHYHVGEEAIESIQRKVLPTWEVQARKRYDSERDRRDEKGDKGDKGDKGERKGPESKRDKDTR